MKEYKLNKMIGMEHTVPFATDGGNVYVTFRKIEKDYPYGTFSTEDKGLQSAIEGSSAFKDGRVASTTLGIQDTSTKTTANSALGGGGENNVFVDVDTVAGARELLNKEPFNIPFSQLPNKVKVLEKAAELGVSFPNLID